MSVSNILISLSVIFTSVSFIEPGVFSLWMNKYFLNSWDYHIYFVQFFTSNLLHWGLMHLFFNSVFVYYFWNILEWLIWRRKYISFFIFTVFFNGIAITYLSNWNTVWISWFAIALLTYYTLELRSRKMEEYRWWITAIIINIWLGFHPQISMVWHLAWAIAWIIFYLLNKDFLRKLMQPLKKWEEV